MRLTYSYDLDTENKQRIFNRILVENRIGVAAAARIGLCGQEANRAEGGGDGEVYEKSLEMRHFLVFRYPEEARLAPSIVAGVARMESTKRAAPTEAFG